MRVDAFIGLILGKLYEARPQRMTWNQSSFGLGEMAGTSEELARWKAWSNTMEWLEREGYIRFEPGTISPYNEFEDVELTEKGFCVLNSTPPALKEKRDEKSL